MTVAIHRILVGKLWKCLLEWLKSSWNVYRTNLGGLCY